jgi:hypothetical protein
MDHDSSITHLCWPGKKHVSLRVFSQTTKLRAEPSSASNGSRALAQEDVGRTFARDGLRAFITQGTHIDVVQQMFAGAKYIRSPSREARRKPIASAVTLLALRLMPFIGRHHVTSSGRFSCVTYGAIGGCLGNRFISPMFRAQACAERHQI